MKRSRIFLGVTACLLAVAGIASTKAFKIPTKIVYTGVNFSQQVSTHCAFGASTTKCKLLNGVTLYTSPNRLTARIAYYNAD
jgi:hypothetical protein